MKENFTSVKYFQSSFVCMSRVTNESSEYHNKIIMKTLKIKNLANNISKRANQLYDYLFDKMFGWIFTTEMS